MIGGSKVRMVLSAVLSGGFATLWLVYPTVLRELAPQAAVDSTWLRHEVLNGDLLFGMGEAQVVEGSAAIIGTVDPWEQPFERAWLDADEPLKGRAVWTSWEGSFGVKARGRWLSNDRDYARSILQLRSFTIALACHIPLALLIRRTQREWLLIPALAALPASIALQWLVQLGLSFPSLVVPAEYSVGPCCVIGMLALTKALRPRPVSEVGAGDED